MRIMGLEDSLEKTHIVSIVQGRFRRWECEERKMSMGWKLRKNILGRATA
jgi:hypothetical protein